MIHPALQGLLSGLSCLLGMLGELFIPKSKIVCLPLKHFREQAAYTTGCWLSGTLCRVELGWGQVSICEEIRGLPAPSLEESIILKRTPLADHLINDLPTI